MEHRIEKEIESKIEQERKDDPVQRLKDQLTQISRERSIVYTDDTDTKMTEAWYMCSAGAMPELNGVLFRIVIRGMSIPDAVDEGIQEDPRHRRREPKENAGLMLADLAKCLHRYTSDAQHEEED